MLLITASLYQYRYRMSGFDNNWQQAGLRGYASYANLPPGNYRLEIQCLNREGKVLGKSKGLKVSVAPFLYETRWFQILSGLVLLFSVFIFAAYRERRKLSRSLLENKEKALKKQLSQHFIFNTLNLANADILRGDLETANHNLVRFSKLLRFYFKELTANPGAFESGGRILGAISGIGQPARSRQVGLPGGYRKRPSGQALADSTPFHPALPGKCR